MQCHLAPAGRLRSVRSELGDPVWGWCKTTQLAGAGLAGAAAPLRPRALNTALQDMQPSNVQNTEEKWRIAEILLLILNIEPGMKAFLKRYMIKTI